MCLGRKGIGEKLTKKPTRFLKKRYKKEGQGLGSGFVQFLCKSIFGGAGGLAAAAIHQTELIPWEPNLGQKRGGSISGN